MTAPTETVEHGTYAAYQRPCRCDECKAANREYGRRWRQAMAGSLAADDPRHGTNTAYVGYSCRCDPCTAAHYKVLGEYWLRRARELTARVQIT